MGTVRNRRTPADPRKAKGDTLVPCQVSLLFPPFFGGKAVVPENCAVADLGNSSEHHRKPLESEVINILE
jgi:hypothetical protein